jgi:nucleotide-binding universal stress UspA family protein
MGARYGIYFQEEVHTVVTLAPKKIAFDRILVPSDFSDLSMCALEYAKSIARCYGSQILLEHVSQLPSGYAPSEMPWVELDMTLEVMRQGERRLEEHDAQLRAEGFAVQTILSSGNLQDEVIATAHDQKPDLMVLGTHAVKGVVRLFCGSDAEALLRRVDCPVLVVGPKVRQMKQSVWSLRDVLCASDLNPGSARTPAFACTLAEDHHAAFTLLHIENPARERHSQPLDPEPFQNALARIMSADQRLSGCDPMKSLQTVVSRKEPSSEIVGLARERDSDLIVMGAHSAAEKADHLLRGVIPSVLAEAICPLLLLHHP